MHKKLLKVKIILVFMALISLIFFTNDFGIIDIEKTAIITAIGIDKAENDYEVTVQIAIPQGSTTPVNSKAVVSAKGSTVSEAIHQIGDITGWYPKLIFCNLLILGESVLQEDVKPAVDYFTRTLNMQDSASLAACKGAAKDLIAAATPLDNISSFAIQKILLKNRGMTSDVASINIKTFAVDYYSRSASGFMPQIEMIDVNGEKKSDKNSGSSGGGSGSESSGGDSGGGSGSESSGGGGEGSSGEEGGSNSESGMGSGGGTGNVIFEAARTAMFKNGRIVGILNDHESKVFNMTRKDVQHNIFTVNDADFEGEKIDALLLVESNDAKVKLEMNGALPVLKVRVKIFCRLEDTTSVNAKENLKRSCFVPESICRKAENDFTEYFKSIIGKCRKSGCDLLKLDEKLYRYHHKYYNALKERIYDNLSVDMKVEFHGVKQAEIDDEYNVKK